ncbi:MAG: hypothetical protein EXQ81_03255 [Thermoleophilia bacterium]|nr:hypothetical protein [Thermoleophilia bacterium]
MRFELCRAVARCQARRLRAMAAAAPLPAALVVILVALAPLALVRIGCAVGTEIAAAGSSADVSTALVLGPVLAAAAAGAALAVSLPAREALGQQIAAGPCGDLAAVTASLLFPSLLAMLTLLPSLVSFCLAFAGELPGGRVAGVALALAVVSALPAGAVVAEGVQAAGRGQWARPLGVGVGVGAWVATGAAAGAAPLGMLAPVGRALAGSGPAWEGIAAAGSTAAGLGFLWIVLAASRPERRSPVRRRRSLGLAWRIPVPAAVSSLVVRRDDVRLANVAALGFGAVGALVAVAAGAEAPGPFLLAATTTLLGSVVGALAVCGILSTGYWMWWSSPHGRPSIIATAWYVGLVGAAVPVAIVAAVAAAGSGASWRALEFVAVVVVAGAAVATIAGSLALWRGEGVGDQLSSFAVFAAVAVAASLLMGLVAPRLTSLGLPGPAVAVLVCGALISAALLSLRRRLESDAQ